MFSLKCMGIQSIFFYKIPLDKSTISYDYLGIKFGTVGQLPTEILVIL